MSSGNLQLPQNSIKAVDAEAAEILRSSGPYAQYGMIESPASTLGDYWRILVKRKWTVIAALLIIVTTVTIASFRMRPIYDAVGRIDITRQSDILNIKDRPVNTEDTDFMMSAETQVRILQSDILALQVARKLHLDEKAGSGARPGSLKEHGSSQELAAREAGLIAMIKAPLKVVTIPGTRLIEIHYQSPDPRMAAEVVNALVQTYIEQNLKTKYESTLQAADWLSKQLADLQIKVETSQEKLVRYQKEHEIVGIDEKQNIITSKLDELNKELTMAQSERIQKQAIYQMAAAGGPESVPTLGNELILKLREQEADLKNQYAQLSTQFGPQYPKVVEITNRLKQLEAGLKAEAAKVIKRSQADYLASAEREKMLRTAFEQQKQEANQLNENAIEYTLLKRDAESNRQLYEGLLQKLKEAGIEAGLNSSNVRIVDSARVPLVPFKPNIPRNIALSILVGLSCGIALAFALEVLDNTVHTPEQAVAIASLPSLGMIPLNARLKPKQRARQNLLPAGDGPTERVEIVSLALPKSEIAESYRALRTSILLSSMGAPPRVILVTSALPQEGKTTTSINTAIVLAQQGRRVLLVDGDLRRPSIHKNLKIRTKTGLSSALAGAAALENAIMPSSELSNLHVLPAGPVPPHPAELLGSGLMKSFLAQLRQDYDHIIIDSPPTLSVTDAVMLSVEVDSVVLVIRAGQTTKTALRRARDLLYQVNAKIMGVVVNGIDLRSPDYYHYYYSGSKYSGYYADESESSKASAPSTVTS